MPNGIGKAFLLRMTHDQLSHDAGQGEGAFFDQVPFRRLAVSFADRTGDARPIHPHLGTVQPALPRADGEYEVSPARRPVSQGATVSGNPLLFMEPMGGFEPPTY